MGKLIIRDEIGSEFWDVPVGTTETALFHKKPLYFVSGTSALKYIISDILSEKKVTSAAIPSWCCECMIEPFVEVGISVHFYSVYADENRNLVCDYDTVPNCDITLVLSYFGYDLPRIVGTPKGIVIRDTTHSIFSRNYDDAEYYFGSLRKWAGFWTGGYAVKETPWTTVTAIAEVEEDYLRLRRSAMEQKLKYLCGVTDSKAYLDVFDDAEGWLEQFDVMGSCDRDQQYIRQLDTEYIKAQRRKNARVLLSAVKNIALFPEIAQDDCPMFVPVLFADKETRDRMRRHLISADIYCPAHWPVSELHVLGEREQRLYDCSLSIVCDQRYDTADMLRILDTINAFQE